MYNFAPLPIKHVLSDEFAAFFGSLNPNPFQIATASRLHNSVRDCIEAPYGPCAGLRPTTFLQGSYLQKTATDKINDIDIVVLCQSQSTAMIPPRMDFPLRYMIFKSVSDALQTVPAYRGKIRYGMGSMCVKVDLGIKVEILPVIFMGDNTDPAVEPFALFRPKTGHWEQGYARYHQQWLSLKNANAYDNFIPMVKVVKHLRNRSSINAVSFHIESLLYNVPDAMFEGSPVDYVPRVLGYITSFPITDWLKCTWRTPCGDRAIISASEWNPGSFLHFYGRMCNWAAQAKAAAAERNRSVAIVRWKYLLGPNFK